jgi:hypothetical protein
VSTISYITTRLQDGRTGFRIPVRTRDFSLFRNVHTVLGAHPTSYSMSNVCFSQGRKGHRATNLTSYPRLLKSLRMNGALPLLPLYAVTERRGRTLPLLPFLFTSFLFLLVFLLSFVSSCLSYFYLPFFFINSLVFSFYFSSSPVYLFLYFCISISSSSLKEI